MCRNIQVFTILLFFQMTPLIGKSNAAKEQSSVIRSAIERLNNTTNLLLVCIFSYYNYSKLFIYIEKQKENL